MGIYLTIIQSQKQTISLIQADASAYTPTDLSNYYTKSETSGATEISTALASKQDTLVSGTNIKTINNESILGEGNITIEGGVSESVFTSYSAATDARISEDEEVTAAALNALNDGLSAKQDTLVAGNNITISGNVISAEGGIDSGTVQTMIDGSISGKADTSAVTVAINSAVSGKADSSAVTQEISAAVSGKVDTNAFNTYSAATNARLAEDEEVTAAAFNNLNEALSGKADTSSVYTKSEVDTALATKQATLVSGTNIKTINNESLLGSGNIDIQGGGKAIEAGRGISVTTRETADTVSFNLPISGLPKTTTAVTDNNLVIFGTGNTVDIESKTNQNLDSNIVYGNNNVLSLTGIKCSLQYNTIFGQGNEIANNASLNASSNNNFVFGSNNKVYGNNNKYNLLFGDNNQIQRGSIHNTVFGTGNNPKNQYETIFGKYSVSHSGSTNADKSLFSVGNGTSSAATHNAFEIRQNGDIYCSDGTNDVKLQDTITATAANTTALGGLKLVKLTQSAYNALSPNYDSNTLYVIVN